VTARALALLGLALALAGCPDEPPSVEDAGQTEPEWRPVLEHLDGALLSVWGTSERDVWAVGGALGNGQPTLVMRFDGDGWRRETLAGTDTYWWVHGTGEGDVWLVGERGLITHHDGARFEEHQGGTSATLFGVWAARPGDAWAVGGTPEDPGGDNDVLLHWDGVAWSRETLPESLGVALFKVWGPSPDDVYVVGDAGVVWHKVGGTWLGGGERPRDRPDHHRVRMQCERDLRGGWARSPRARRVRQVEPAG
jgi:hypothetical protein